MALTAEQLQYFSNGYMPDGTFYIPGYSPNGSWNGDTMPDYRGAIDAYYNAQPEGQNAFDYNGQQMRAVRPGEAVFNQNGIIWDANRNQYLTNPENVRPDQGFTLSDYLTIFGMAALPFAAGALLGEGALGAGTGAGGALTQEAMLAEQYMGMGLGAEEAAAMAAADMASFGEMGAYGIGFGADTIPGYAAMTEAQQAALTGLVNSGVPTGTALAAVMGGGAATGGGFLASLGLGGAGSALGGAGSILSGLGSAGGLISAGLGAIAGGSGPSSGTTTTTSGPPEWLQKELQGYLGNAKQVAAGSQYVPMNNYQTDALQGIASQAIEGTQANYSGQQQLNDTLDGYYLNSNPYLDYNIGKAQDDLVQQYQLGTAAQTDAAAARSHALGGSSYNQLTAYNNNNLANQLNNVDATMRGANYSNERNNQMSALGQVPGMINANYADWNNLYNAGNMLQQQNQTQASWPEHQLGIQQGAMQTALGGAGTVQSTPWQTNKTAGLLGGAATGLSLWNQFNRGS